MSDLPGSRHDSQQPDRAGQPDCGECFFGDVEGGQIIHGLLALRDVARRIDQDDLDAQGESTFGVCNAKPAEILEHRLSLAELGFDLNKTAAVALGKVGVPSGFQGARCQAQFTQVSVPDHLQGLHDVQFKRALGVGFGRDRVVAPSFVGEEPEEVLFDQGSGPPSGEHADNGANLIRKVRIDRFNLFGRAVVVKTFEFHLRAALWCEAVWEPLLTKPDEHSNVKHARIFKSLHPLNRFCTDLLLHREVNDPFVHRIAFVGSLGPAK